MLIDLTDYGFEILHLSNLCQNNNIIDGSLIFLNNPLPVESYYFPGQGIYSYRYLSMPIEDMLSGTNFKFNSMEEINEYVSLFDLDKIRIEGRDKPDMSKFFENRSFKATLDIDEEMLLYIKIKFETILKETQNV